MSVAYDVFLADVKGQRIDQLTGYTRLSWTQIVNDVGQIMIEFPAEKFDRAAFQVDYRLELWRRPVGGKMGLLRVYRCRYLARQNQGGQKTITIGGPDGIDLLATRIIASADGSSGANKSGPADNVMKTYVNEAIGSAAAGGRAKNIDGAFNVEISASQGPSVVIAAARKELLTVLQDIHAATRTLGDPVYFDIENPNVTDWMFRTFIKTRGRDLTSQVKVSEEAGTLANPGLTQDWRDEVTRLYLGAGGKASNRYVAEMADSVREALSIFNRREAFVDATNFTTSGQISEKGRAELWKKRPIRRFSGDLIDAPTNRFGIHWNFGDRITALFEDEQYAVDIMALQGVYQDGHEELNCRLEYVS